MSYLKRVVRRLLVLPLFTAGSERLMGECGVIFMLHRFLDPEIGSYGHDPRHVRRVLAYLRREKYEVVSLEEMFDRLVNGGKLNGTVAFTIDDGYRDEVLIGGKVFAEFDCPVTTFVTTGVADKQLWFWWDRIDYVLRNTHRRKLRTRLGNSEVVSDWGSDADREHAKEILVNICKQVPEEAKRAAIDQLAMQAEVAIPADIPSKYAVASWDEMRSAERRGMTFGPHTTTHPILSQTSAEQSATEITESWRRLSAELAHPVPIFCYPNGRPGDFGQREIENLRRAGFHGAVVGIPRYATAGDFSRSADGPYLVPRFGLPDDMSDVIQLVKGVEKLKQIIRGEWRQNAWADS